MYSRLFILSFLLSSLTNIDGSETDVIELTDDDYDSSITQFDTALVMLYAPWCGYCKKLKPEYEKAASILIKNDPPINLLKIDCTGSGIAVCNKHEVPSYPTLKIFRSGRFTKEYDGPRSAEGIVKYMKTQLEPASRKISSLSDFVKWLSRDEVTVVGFFKQDSDLKKSFLNVADKIKEKINFAHSEEEEVLKDQQIETEAVKLFRPKILHNKFEPNVIEYTGGSDDTELENFIKENYHGLVGHRTTENIDDFKHPLVVAFYSIDYVKNPKGTNYWRNRILKVAKNYKGKYNFAISAKDEFQRELREFGFDDVPSEKPVICSKDINKQKFIMKDEFSVDAFEKFMKELDAGKLEPFLKSEDLPADNSGPVKEVVAKNFHEEVINNGKDTFIEFYAPWCGHCKYLAPFFDELGEKFKNENVAIIKMDATANDVPLGFEVQGFPTLYWLPKDNKDKPVRYEDELELEHFIKYIASHSTDELKGFDRNGNAKSVSENEEL